MSPTIDFRGVYVAFTRACVILEEITPEHIEFDNKTGEGYHLFKDVLPPPSPGREFGIDGRNC